MVEMLNRGLCAKGFPLLESVAASKEELAGGVQDVVRRGSEMPRWPPDNDDQSTPASRRTLSLPPVNNCGGLVLNRKL